MANEGLDKDFIESLKNEKMIDYKNFLNNLVNYHEDNREQKGLESDKKAYDSVDSKDNNIYSSGIFIEETKVKKVTGDDGVDIFYNYGKIESKNKNKEEENGKDEKEKCRQREEFLLEEDSSKKENIINKSESQFTDKNENNIKDEDNESNKRQIFEYKSGNISEEGKDEKKLHEENNNPQINDKKGEENNISENYKESVPIGNSLLAE